jgi:hypothetical protein
MYGSILALLVVASKSSTAAPCAVYRVNGYCNGRELLGPRGLARHTSAEMNADLSVMRIALTLLSITPWPQSITTVLSAGHLGVRVLAMVSVFMMTRRETVVD